MNYGNFESAFFALLSCAKGNKEIEDALMKWSNKYVKEIGINYMLSPVDDVNESIRASYKEDAYQKIIKYIREEKLSFEDERVDRFGTAREIRLFVVRG